MSLDTVSNEILSIILQYANIPLQELIKLRAVSSRWLAVIESLLKQETKLVIHVNDSNINRIEKGPNDLVVVPEDRYFDSNYFNDNIVDQFATLFPFIEELSVDVTSIPFFRKLPKLLLHYRRTLRHFTLSGKYYYQAEATNGTFNWFQPTKTSARIAEAINSLLNLTSLQLFTTLLNARLVFGLEPTLGRLERFSFYDHEMICAIDCQPMCQKIFSSLSGRCTYLDMITDHFNWSSTKVDDSLTYLNLRRVNEHHLARICKKFYELRTCILNVSFNQDGHFNTVKKIHLTTNMFRRLSRLPKLTNLQLYWFTFSAENLKPPSEGDHPLSTVEQFSLSLLQSDDDDDDTNFDGLYFCKTFASWLPRLKQITIKCSKQFQETIQQHLDEFSSSTVVCFN